MASTVSRTRWGAKAPRTGIPLYEPAEVRGIAVHHTAGPAPGAHSDCDNIVRGIQASQMNKGYKDIAYNFLVCKHGFVFVGRGFTKRSGANGETQGDIANRQYLSVCVLGKNPPITEAIADCIRFVRFGVMQKYGRLKTDCKPHSAFVGTVCPGDNGRAWIDKKGFLF